MTQTKTPEEKLYLFVWEDVLNDYTSGIAFAIAHDMEEALRIINKGASYTLDLPIDKMKKYKIKPIGFHIHGGG